MSSIGSRVRSIAAAAALTLALCGCVVTARPYGGAYVTIAPPPLRAEVVGVAPAPGWFWINGYWGWDGYRHVWIPGRWAAPRPGYRWVPHRWVHEGGGWRMAEGHWVRR